MHELIVGHEREIRELCRRFHVRRLDLFGSAATERFDISRSDVDLIVSFEPLPMGEYAEAWFGLAEALAALFGRHVDLVTEGSVRNPFLRAEIDRTRQPLHAA